MSRGRVIGRHVAGVAAFLLICFQGLPWGSSAIASDPIRLGPESAGEIRLVQRLSPLPQSSRPVPSPARSMPQPKLPKSDPAKTPPPVAQVIVTIKATPSSTGFGEVTVKSNTGLPAPNSHLFPVSPLDSRTFQATSGDTVRLEAGTYDPDQQFIGWGAPCAQAGTNPICLFTVPALGSTPEILLRFEAK